MTGVSLRAVQDWEAGYNISWPNAVALARALDSTPDHILDGKPAAEAPAVPVDANDLAVRVGRLEAQLPFGAERADVLREHDRFVRSSFEQIGERVTRLEEAIGAMTESLRETALAVKELRSQAGVQPQPVQRARRSAAQRASGQRAGD